MKASSRHSNTFPLLALPNTQIDKASPYSTFDEINGLHPWKFAVPNGFIDYEARVLRKSKIAYFNFNLAKEIGLIPGEHPNTLNKDLEKKLIETFSLRIINEYDQLSGTTFPKKDIKTHRYMATRYLQLQHNNKAGATSGDGRSIWNGHFTSPNGVDWDFSSCGTGVTRLSPGFVKEGKPIKTGDKKVSYGSGLADVDEGLIAAILSESFNHRGMHTERTLLIVEGPEGRSVNVRASKNLLRPSHLFLHLKQGNQLMLKSALDFYASKQIFNHEWPASLKEQEKYDFFLESIAKKYGQFVAQLEDQYIFCWLDWDGDNMLLNGGIIDYGSIRQFGLCHHQYRYDDVDRFSTNIKEQKHKAKYLVQTFIQLIDFVRTGRKKHVHHFAGSEYLKTFERSYKETTNDLFLKRIGLNKEIRKKTLKQRPDLVADLLKVYRKLERAVSKRGIRATADGINNPAIFDTRQLLRELPKQQMLLRRELSSSEFFHMIKSKHCSQKELRSYIKRSPLAAAFQKRYFAILHFAYKEKSHRRALLESTMRAHENNRSDYATGDGIIHVVSELLHHKKKMSRMEFIRLVDAYIQWQQGLPGKQKLRKNSKRLLQKLMRITKEHAHTI